MAALRQGAGGGTDPVMCSAVPSGWSQPEMLLMTGWGSYDTKMISWLCSPLTARVTGWLYPGNNGRVVVRERGVGVGPQGPPRHGQADAQRCRGMPVQCRGDAGSDALEGVGGPPPPPGPPAYARPLSPLRKVPASTAFVTDSNRPQPP